MTVYSLPQVRVDGVLLDPWRVLLPLEYGYGRPSPTQQPDAGGLAFEYVGTPAFQRGSRVEVLLGGDVLWRGDITARDVTWESINDEPVYSVVGTGWLYRLARVFARERVWVAAGTDAQQVAAVIAAFAPWMDAGIDPPVTLDNVTDTALQQGWWINEGADLLGVLADHGATTGATLWEFADGVRYTGPPAREDAPPPAADHLLRRHLVEMPVEYVESAVINRVTLLYGRFPQDSDGSTVGEWQWKLGATAPAQGAVHWDAATQTLRVHEVDNNGTNMRLDLLNAILGNGVFVLSPVDGRELTGIIDQRTITGQVFAFVLSQPQAGSIGYPTTNAVCSLSTGAPSGQVVLALDDAASQAQYGPQEVKVTTRYADVAGAGPRGNRLFARWKRPRWLYTFLANLNFDSTQAEFDLITTLRPNDAVRVGGIDETKPGRGGGASVFVEGVVHSWDRTTEGEPTLRVQLGTSPQSAWTELGGYGTGPYGHRPYGGSP